MSIASWRRSITRVVPLALLLTACGGGTPAPSHAAPASAGAAHVRLQGAGSTFDTPLFSRAFAELQKETGLEVNYQSIGSGGGVRQLINGVIDFGATDVPLNDEQTAAAARAGGEVVHIPVAMGAVSIGYNLPVSGLKLDGDTLAGIYLGSITMWNDRAIAAINPGVRLPATPIAVVHRSDGSGTTFIFTSYLSAVSQAWKSQVGASGVVKWPHGIGAKGSEGLAGQVMNTPGAIGYFEMAYAQENQITSASLKNAAGIFVEPSVDGAAAAGAGAASQMPADLKAVFVNAPGARSYPITGFSWIVVFKKQKDAARGRELVQVLRYLTTDAQRFAAPLAYAPLPKAVQEMAGHAIDTIR
jgi:phosphate transport system substrate-binding protein